MNNELEGSGRGLVWGTVPTLFRREWGKTRKTSGRHSSGPKFLPRTSQTQAGMLTTWPRSSAASIGLLTTFGVRSLWYEICETRTHDISHGNPLYVPTPRASTAPVSSGRKAAFMSSFSNKTQTVGNPAAHNAAIKNQVGSPPAAVARCTNGPFKTLRGS